MTSKSRNMRSEATDRVKLDVAAATRMLVGQGILDYSGHVSARIPNADAFVIQNGVASRAELEPEQVLVVGYDGAILEGEGQPPSELAIHLEILKSRPDVEAVLHCHLELSIAFTMMEGVRLAPMRARASRWKSGIPIHPDPSHIKKQEQGKALAQTLGPHHAALMRAHGMVLVAESVRALMVDAVHFKENAQAMMEVLQAGARTIPLTGSEIDQIEKMETRAWHNVKLWNYYARRGFADGLLSESWRTGVLPDEKSLLR